MFLKDNYVFYSFLNRNNCLHQLLFGNIKVADSLKRLLSTLKPTSSSPFSQEALVHPKLNYVYAFELEVFNPEVFVK